MAMEKLPKNPNYTFKALQGYTKHIVWEKLWNDACK